METKVCIKCGIEKELHLFRKQKSYKDGHENTCKECLYGHKPLKRYTKNSELLTEKECLMCKKTLPTDKFDFTIKNNRKTYSSDCKECRNKRNARIRMEKRFYRRKDLYKNYGITIEDFERMHLEQKGECKICGDSINKGRILAVDHNHATGEVRGLLCHNCNSGLGMFKDNIDILLSAINYLKESMSVKD